MTNRLQHLSISFSPQEDRLVLHIGTTGDESYRLWLTRRFAKLLWLALVRALEAYPEIKRQSLPEAKSAVLAFQHEQAVRASTFTTAKRTENTESEDPAAAPEAPPLLITGLRFANQDETLTRLVFQARDAIAVTVNLNQALMHSLCHMLIETSTKAEWDLDLQIADPAPAAPKSQSQMH